MPQAPQFHRQEVVIVRKRLVHLLLAACVVLALTPMPSASASSGTYTTSVTNESTYRVSAAPRMTLQQLQEKFPDRRYWNGGNVDATTGSPCPSHANTSSCNCFTTDGGQAWQCYGFALKLGYDAYGVSPRSWSTTTASSYVDSLKPGDIVDNSGNPYHTVFVIGVTDTDIIVGECNYGGRCLIRWGRHIPKSTVKGYGTLKIYIAPAALPTAAAVTPEISLSQSSATLPVGGSAAVTIGTKSPGTIYLKGYISNPSICGGHWGSWNSAGTERPLTITGKAVGSAAITVVMYDSASDAELTRKTISVIVQPAPSAPSAQLRVETLTTLNQPGTASLYPTVFKGYLRAAAKYDAYGDSAGSQHIGRIYVNDEFRVQSVYANGGELWMSALCPWDGYPSGRTVYARLDGALDTSFAPYTAIASTAAAVYTRSDGQSRYGSLGSGDAVTVAGLSGGYAQVIYPLSAGGYKIGWCDAGALTRPEIQSVTAASSNSVKLQCSLASYATNRMVILSENMQVLLRRDFTGGSPTISNLTPGRTYYLYIESELNNGTGTATSAVKKITL